MTVITVRPQGSGAWSNTAWVAYTGGSPAGTLWDNTADNSDSSWAAAPLSWGFVSLTVPYTQQLPDLAQIRQVQVRMRGSSGGGGTAFTNVWLVSARPGSPVANEVVAYGYLFGGAIATATFPAATRNPQGGPWTVDDLRYLQVWMWAQYPVNIYEVYVDITYNQAPTATITAPVGTVTGTSRPTITWTYSDPENDQQERWVTRVFTEAVAGAPGFNPYTPGGSVWDGTDLWPGAPQTTSVQIGRALPNGAYRVYVAVADAGSNGRFGPVAVSKFAVSSTNPAPPGLIAVPDAVNQRAILNVSAKDNLLTLAQASHEHNASTDPWDWLALALCSVAPSSAAFFEGANSMAMTATAAGDMQARTRFGAVGILVTAGATYSVLAKAKAAATPRACTVELRWYQGATFLSSTVGSSATNATSGWTDVTLIDVPAPTGADHVTLVVTVKGVANGEVHYWDRLAVMPGNSTTWSRGGLDSPNILGPNDGSVEVGNLGHWLARYNCSIARVTGVVSGPHGTAAVEATATASDLMAVQVGGLAVPWTAPVTPGQLYTALGSILTSVAGRSVLVYLRWFAANGYLSEVSSALLPLTQNVWTQVSVTAEAPDGATGASLHFDIPAVAAGEKARYDAVSLHEGTTTQWKQSGGVTRRPYVEFSDDAGVTWDQVRLSGLEFFDPATRLAQVYDYEAPPNSRRRYRARTWVLDPASGAVLLSDPSPAFDLAVPSRGWVLKDPLAFTAGMRVDIRGDLTTTAAGREQVYTLLGRELPLVRSDVPSGETFDLQLNFFTQADWEAFERARRARRTMLLQSDMSDQWYVQFADARKVTLYSSPSRRLSPYRVAACTAVEVDRPDADRA